MLFSFPSRYYCAIGLWLCLGLAVNSAVFRHPIQDALLFGQLHIPFIYRTITFYGVAFQQLRFGNLEIYAHHISASLSQGDSVRPWSFSLSANKDIINLFSLPAGTKMFQFPAYLHTALRRVHSEIFGSKLACSSPKLIAACHVLHHLPKPSYPFNSIN